MERILEILGFGLNRNNQDIKKNTEEKQVFIKPGKYPAGSQKSNF